MFNYSRTVTESSKRRIKAGLCIFAFATIAGLWLPARSGKGLTASLASPESHGPYSTAFRHAENPLSEGGKWLNGHADGLDWADVETVPGLAFGAEIGGSRPEPQKYDDSTALLKGTWGPNQTVQATVYSVHPNQDDKVWEEVEIRLRSSITPHSCTGYEIMFRCSKIPQAYCNVARWEGPLGKFTYLKNMGGSKYGVKTGDVVKASMIGSTLTVYINGEQIFELNDNKFTSGSPGMGFFLDGATGVNRDFGFSSFTATDR
ncbi:MAG: hypothetical protein ABSF46_02295 [Terriglobia bacterium]|jgi:hypothetical protein